LSLLTFVFIFGAKVGKIILSAKLFAEKVTFCGKKALSLRQFLTIK